MKSSLKFLTFVAVLAIGAGVLGGAWDALSSEKKRDQVAATPSHGEEAQEEESGHGAAVEEEEEEAGGHGIRWGYEGKTGPSRWAKLSKDYRLCGIGETQSPIDISALTGTSVEPIAFDYNLTPLEIVHNGHTVQVNYQPGSGITVGGKRYELLQFHFHSPSEHSVAGRQAAMEVHFVHQSADGELAVVGALIEVGEENMALREPWAIMPKKAGKPRLEKRVLINARDLLPRGTGYYRYMGSLTTPPCSEGVNWYLLTQPISASMEQVKKFAAAVDANNRPTQALNNRLVLAPMAGE
ncbi:MAG: carbonic anhydrase family protein [Proteobacteria bacterium]|nr:carbonic anhydrase family protein [Pseudomonadota bacterium]